MHLRINLNVDGTATYFKWVGDNEEGDYDFVHPVPPREAMKYIRDGCTLDITALDPDDDSRVFSNLDGDLRLEEN